MAEMPRSWERMLAEAIGAEEQRVALKPEGYREVGLGEGLGNINDAFVEHLKGRWAELSSPVTEEEFSNENLMETAMNFGPGALAGILRKEAIKGLAAGAKGYLNLAKGLSDPTKLRDYRAAIGSTLKEIRQTPQELWDTVGKVNWKYMKRARGEQEPFAMEPTAAEPRATSGINFNPLGANETTVWHELAHARQFEPGKAKVPYRGLDLSESEMSDYLRSINWELRGGKSNEEYMKELYGRNPLETSAEAFARKMVEEGPERMEELYPKILGRSIEQFEEKFPKEASRAFFKALHRKK
jgi:hypothetical protein